MTPEEMRSSSAAKVKQIMDLMRTLHVRVEARERLNIQDGFIEKTVFWIDDENYPSPAPSGETGATGEAPTGETAEVAPTGETAPTEETAPTGETAA